MPCAFGNLVDHILNAWWSVGRCIPTPTCLVEQASGCPVADCLAALYRRTGQRTPRGGANIPRRIEIAARIASCSVSLGKLADGACDDTKPSAWSPGQAIEAIAAIAAIAAIELTRKNLRAVGVCASEASYLCTFFHLLACALGPGTQVRVRRETTRPMVLYVWPDRFGRDHRPCQLLAVLSVVGMLPWIGATVVMHLCPDLTHVADARG